MPAESLDPVNCGETLLKRSGYAAFMISKLIQEIAEMGDQGVEISKVYGMSRTPTGIRILKNADFQIIKEYDSGKITFELDVVKSDERILREYKDALEQWKKVHPTANTRSC